MTSHWAGSQLKSNIYKNGFKFKVWSQHETINFTKTSSDNNLLIQVFEDSKGSTLTKLDIIDKVLDKIDLVLIMSVFPGFGGQKFMPEVIEKIKSLKKLKEERKLNLDIEVDGGINFENNKILIKAGANILVSGTTIFKENNGNIKKNIDFLKLV